jgi:hypothetical protein
MVANVATCDHHPRTASGNEHPADELLKQKSSEANNDIMTGNRAVVIF